MNIHHFRRTSLAYLSIAAKWNDRFYCWLTISFTSYFVSLTDTNCWLSFLTVKQFEAKNANQGANSSHSELGMSEVTSRDGLAREACRRVPSLLNILSTLIEPVALLVRVMTPNLWWAGSSSTPTVYFLSTPFTLYCLLK